MKPSLLCLGALLCAGAFAHADLVMEETVESVVSKGPLTLKIKGDQARMDFPMGAGTMTMFIDSAKDTMITLQPADKVAVEMDLKERRAAAANLLRKTGAKNVAPKPVATGKKQKIGEWDAEEYTITTIGEDGSTMRLWVAKTFPQGKELQARIGKFSKLYHQAGGVDVANLNLPGMVVKTETEDAIGKSITTLRSIREEEVPAEVFAIPAGYRKIVSHDSESE